MHMHMRKHKHRTQIFRPSMSALGMCTLYYQCYHLETKPHRDWREFSQADTNAAVADAQTLLSYLLEMPDVVMVDLNVGTFKGSHLYVLSRSHLPTAEALSIVHGKEVRRADREEAVGSDVIWFSVNGRRTNTLDRVPPPPKPYFFEAVGHNYGSGPVLLTAAAEDWRVVALGALPDSFVLCNGPHGDYLGIPFSFTM